MSESSVTNVFPPNDESAEVAARPKEVSGSSPAALLRRCRPGQAKSTNTLSKTTKHGAGVPMPSSHHHFANECKSPHAAESSHIPRSCSSLQKTASKLMSSLRYKSQPRQSHNEYLINSSFYQKQKLFLKRQQSRKRNETCGIISNQHEINTQESQQLPEVSACQDGEALQPFRRNKGLDMASARMHMMSTRVVGGQRRKFVSQLQMYTSPSRQS